MKYLHTDEAPAAVGPYSQATEVNVGAGGLVFVSGQLGLDPETMKLREGLKAQAAQALVNLTAILDAAGCNLDQVAKVDVFLADMADFKAFNEVYAEYMEDRKPARAAVGVAALPLGGLVEVACVAVKG